MGKPNKVEGAVSNVFVYLVWHTHKTKESEDTKLIGVYSSESQADDAVARARQKPGFRDLPEGFCIAKYVLDKDEWTDGYVTDHYFLREE
jgi:hypothetical protein